MRLNLTFCIQHLGDVQVFLCHLKGSVQVANGVILDGCDRERSKVSREQRLRSWGWGGAEAHLAQFGVVDEVGPMSVDESTEGQAILPARQRQGVSGLW